MMEKFQLISEREKLEYESLPEYVREPRVTTRDSYAAKKATVPQAPVKPASVYTEEFEKPLPKAAELDALWPGVSADFIHSSRRGPSFYLTIGFLGGAVASLILVGGFSLVSAMVSSPQSKSIVTAQGNSSTTSQMRSGIGTAGGTNTASPQVGSAAGAAVGAGEAIMPNVPTYEVQTGDTLAGIALKTYHRATPRLLDEICRANGMRNANVLSLGQKLTLPEYRPGQVATSPSVTTN